MKLRYMDMQNFRGIKEKSIKFADDMKLIGQNGSFKTTIMAAYFWVMNDTDTDLTANPNVRPENADDGVVTKVTVGLDFDGKEVDFTKIQKVKTKEGTDGKVKTTKTNSYEVNTVPKSQKDAFKYLEECGFDAEHFMMFSHTDYFLKDMTEKKARTAIRSTLFGMSQDIPDLKVAKKAKLKDLAALLEKYDKEEIISMQNATKRKISQEYGRNGEALDNRIDGMNNAKADVPEDAEARLKTADAELKELEKQLADFTSGDDKGVNAKIKDLEEKKRDYLDKKVNEVVAENNKIMKKQQEVQTELSQTSNKMDSLETEINRNKGFIFQLEKDIKELQGSYKVAKAKEFDESKTVCPVCKRRFSEKKIADIKSAFEEEKKNSLEEITRLGKELAEKRDTLKEAVKASEKELKAVGKKVEKIKKTFMELPKPKSMPGADDFTKEIDSQIEELKAELHKGEDTKKRDLQIKIGEAKERFAQASSDVAKAENNARIDEKIAELQKNRIEYEQARLDCEKILDQVKTLEMTKNEMLTEQINSHFKLVKWSLFEVQANGEILSDRAVPYIDGHSMIDAANTGRKILGKLDIVSSLQKFYGQSYPIWLDNAEALTDNTTERIEVDSQFIRLIAVNGAELTVEGN